MVNLATLLRAGVNPRGGLLSLALCASIQRFSIARIQLHFFCCRIACLVVVVWIRAQLRDTVLCH